MTLVQELENSIDIVELVSKYARLKKAGVNYKSNCPFPGHSEKTPSFVVSPVKQIAYCFGCHRGGGPVKFLMDIENFEFKEAMELLGEMTGKKVQFSEKTKEQVAEEKNIYQIFKDATYYYHKTLAENEEICDYLFKRGITREDIKTFQLGYSDSANGLHSFLTGRGFTENIIDESQIFSNYDGKRDKFFGRIIFPIQSLRGETVAFAGRIIHNGEPKYLNSPASRIYDKSSILYGLYQGKKEILEEDSVIICEGYMDVIALHRAGIKNTVCVSGTALTEKQIDILKRLTKKFFLCFDNDKAGQNATQLSLELLKNKGIEVRIISIDGGKDPDEIVASGEDFKKYLKTSLSPIAYFIANTDFSSESIEDKKNILKNIIGVLKSYSDQIERETYIKEIAILMKVSEKIIYDQLNRSKVGNEENSHQEYKNTPFTSEEMAIGYLLLDEKYAPIIRENLIFQQDISHPLKKILNDPKQVDDFGIKEKERLRGLSLKLEEENNGFTEEKIKDILIKTAQKINTEIYKTLYTKYKASLGIDKDAEIKLLELIQQAKKYGLK